jgi:hypothetical protein
MLMCEFLTAVHHKLPVKVIVYNNSSLGLTVLEAEVGILVFVGVLSLCSNARTSHCGSTSGSPKASNRRGPSGL